MAFVPSDRALRLLDLLLPAMTGEQGAVNLRLQDLGYPHVDTSPGARCWWRFHGKASVRSWATRSGLVLEVYECACGDRAWISAPAGGRLERIR